MGQIRDFVYLDISRLYSMYSQVFEKLTESVIEERANKVFLPVQIRKRMKLLV